jgi:transcription termination/antitermination protein NusG
LTNDPDQPENSTPPPAEVEETLVEEILVEAVVEAEMIHEAADEAADQVLESAVEDAEALLAADDEEGAAEVISEGIAEAETIEVIGEVAAEEVLAEAVTEALVLEDAAEPVVVEETVVVEDAPEPPPETKPETKPESKRAKAAKAAAQTAEEAAADPFGGPGDWYVVHTYAGYENKVKANLESRIKTMQMESKIFRVHIPMEDVMEIKSGKKQVVQKKVFPGYLLVKMIYDNDSWYVVRNTPGVTGFVSAGTGSKPTPLSKREVEKILIVKKEEVKPQFRLGFEENDVVRIISGPFADFNGTISEINVDQSKLKVLVNIFDRETPVELGFDQVSKV